MGLDRGTGNKIKRRMKCKGRGFNGRDPYNTLANLIYSQAIAGWEGIDVVDICSPMLRVTDIHLI